MAAVEVPVEWFACSACPDRGPMGGPVQVQNHAVAAHQVDPGGMVAFVVDHITRLPAVDVVRVQRNPDLAGLEPALLVGGQLVHAHPAGGCVPPCAIHTPTEHHMATWAQNWRDDRGITERICPHGIGHPDPDDQTIDTVHGCDGCCQEGSDQ